MNLFRLIIVIFLFITVSNKSFSQDTIHWRPDYKLKWEDFQGIPDSTSQHKAISSPSINYSLFYNEKTFNYEVFCSFNKKKSWVKGKDSVLLIHERGHFDIAELFARKLRQLFKSYNLNAPTIKNDFKKMYDKVRIERDKMDDLYDKETDFSKNKQKQAYWNKKIVQELKKLKEFIE